MPSHPMMKEEGCAIVQPQFGKKPPPLSHNSLADNSGENCNCRSTWYNRVIMKTMHSTCAINTYNVRVVMRIEEIDMPLQSNLQLLGRMMKQLQNFNDTAIVSNKVSAIQVPNSNNEGIYSLALARM